MKKLLLLLVPIYIFAAQKTLQQRISTLENELQSLKKENQINFEEDRTLLEKVEKKTILDKINLSPELMLRLDKFHYHNRGIKGESTPIMQEVEGGAIPTNIQRRDEFTKDYKIASLIRFRLNMEMTLENIKFHGRLVNMTSSQSSQRICILSPDIQKGTAGSAFDVDRAYIDYKMDSFLGDKFTFSFGILPTTNGTPMQYAENKKRTSLFPALVFDMDTYGLIGTQKFSDDFFARFILARAYILRANFYPYQCNRENIDNANIIGLYADKKFTFFQSKALLSFGVNILNDLEAHPYLGPDVTSEFSHNLGTMITFGAGVDLPNIALTDTTIFIHSAISNPHPNGTKEDYKITDLNSSTTIDGNPGFTTSDYASGPMLGSNGYALYLGSKYKINNKINVGLEYNYGSKYWFSATQGAEDIYNKLAIRGSVYELYSIWQFNKYINAKISYLNIQEDYTGSGWHFGEPAKKDARQSIASLSFEARF